MCWFFRLLYMSKDNLAKLNFYIEKCGEIDALVDNLAKAITEVDKAHEGMVRLLESMMGSDEKRANSTIVSRSFVAAVPFLQELRSMARHIRETCQAAIGHVTSLDKSVHATEHYEEKLERAGDGVLFFQEKKLDWFVRNEWKLSNARSTKERSEKVVDGVGVYLKFGVVEEAEQCMQIYANFLAVFSGSVFFDFDILSGNDKYRLIKTG